MTDRGPRAAENVKGRGKTLECTVPSFVSFVATIEDGLDNLSYALDTFAVVEWLPVKMSAK